MGCLIRKYVITENVTIKEICEVLDINLESFYSIHIADNIDRTKFWRKFENDEIILTEK